MSSSEKVPHKCEENDSSFEINNDNELAVYGTDEYYLIKVRFCPFCGEKLK